MADEEDKIVIEDGDFEKPGMDLGSLKLFGLLMGGMMDETHRVTNEVHDYEKGRADRFEKGLQIALDLVSEIRPEVPRSSEGGILLMRLQNLIITALYHKEVDLEQFITRGEWE